MACKKGGSKKGGKTGKTGKEEQRSFTIYLAIAPESTGASLI